MGVMVERTGGQRGGWTHSRGPASGPEDPPSLPPRWLHSPGPPCRT